MKRILIIFGAVLIFAAATSCQFPETTITDLHKCQRWMNNARSAQDSADVWDMSTHTGWWCGQLLNDDNNLQKPRGAQKG